MVFARSLTAIVLLASSWSYAGEGDFVTVNMMFKDGLDGTESDGRFFDSLAGPDQKAKVTVTDADWAAGKQAVLRKIADGVRGYENVNLNYSGHGEVDKNTSGQDEFLFVSGPYMKCTDVCYQTCKEKAEKDFNRDRKPCESALKNCMSAAKDAATKQTCIKLQGACDRPVYEKVQAARDACENPPTGEPCGETCKEKYVITTGDMDLVLKNKRVFGVIDACHSAKFTNDLKVKDKLLVASAGENETVIDSKDGGYVVKMLRQDLSDLCGLNRDRNSSVSYKEFLRRNFPAAEIEKVKMTPSVAFAGDFDFNSLKLTDFDQTSCQAVPLNHGAENDGSLH